jgi:hypothetical protein
MSFFSNKNLGGGRPSFIREKDTNQAQPSAPSENILPETLPLPSPIEEHVHSSEEPPARTHDSIVASNPLFDGASNPIFDTAVNRNMAITDNSGTY